MSETSVPISLRASGGERGSGCLRPPYPCLKASGDERGSGCLRPPYPSVSVGVREVLDV